MLCDLCCRPSANPRLQGISLAGQSLGLIPIALCALGSLASEAQAEAQYSASSYYRYQESDYQSHSWSDSDPKHVSFGTGATGPSSFTLRDGDGYAASWGHADAAALDLGSSSWAVSTPNNYLAQAQLDATALNHLTITPGTSGLPNGQPVNLQLQVHLDGTLSVSGTPHPGVSDGSTSNVTASLTIHDPEGNTLAQLSASGSLSGITSWSMFTGEFQYGAKWTETWQTQSNIHPADPHNDSDTFSATGGGLKTASHSLNTGWLLLDFQSTVGQTLNVDALLRTNASASGDCASQSAFGNTLSLALTAYDPGLGLSWEVIPEPASLSLLLFAGPMLLRRR